MRGDVMLVNDEAIAPPGVRTGQEVAAAGLARRSRRSWSHLDETPMARRARRDRSAPRLEILESRVLLSGVGPGRRPSRLSAWGTRADGPRPGAIEVGDGRAGRIPGAIRDVGRIAAALVPNDGMFGQLWGLDNARDVDIDAPEAWSVTTGSPSTIVAVLDTGIDLDHPELAGRIWTNPGEVAANGVDDDGNGYVDDIHGWNFAYGTNDVQDDNGHGSHVSGTIAASGNDGLGVVGVAWNATILPLKILAADGGGEVDAAIAAIGYAVQGGARVINASWTLDSFSKPLIDAIRAAGAQGVVFVNAAGNEGTNNDRTRANRDRPSNQITVAAIDPTGKLAAFSNYGRKSVDLVAPGWGSGARCPADTIPTRGHRWRPHTSRGWSPSWRDSIPSTPPSNWSHASWRRPSPWRTCRRRSGPGASSMRLSPWASASPRAYIRPASTADRGRRLSPSHRGGGEVSLQALGDGRSRGNHPSRPGFLTPRPPRQRRRLSKVRGLSLRCQAGYDPRQDGAKACSRRSHAPDNPPPTAQPPRRQRRL